MALQKTPEVPPGTVKVRQHPDRGSDGYRWFLIEIGRGRYVKRLNVSEPEAHQIIVQFSHLVI